MLDEVTRRRGRATSGVDPRIGSVVADRYRVLEALGRGGMGTVYRVRDTTLDVDVALKWIPATEPQAWERIQREVRLARKVTHPNVCRVYDVASDGASAFLTMEIVRGESLAARLGRERPALGEVMAILRGVAEGLAAAHAAGVVHRDLTPANVIVDATGRPIIIDFGIASGTVDGDTEAAGTRGYIAPEVAAGDGADARADVWSFGALALRMLDGLAAPASMRTLIDRCRSVSPSERPADGSALAAALARGHRRGRTVAVAIGVAALALTGAALVAVTRDRVDLPDVVIAADALRPGFAMGRVLGPPRSSAAAEAAIRDELTYVYGIDGAPPGVAPTDLTLAASGGGWRLADGTREAHGATIRGVARAFAEELHGRTPARRPTQAELAAAGTDSAAAWLSWRRARRRAMLQDWEGVRAGCRDALTSDPGFALAALEHALSFDAGDRGQVAALARAFELAARRPPAGPWRYVLAIVAASGREAEQAEAFAAARRAATDDVDRRYLEVRWAISLLVTAQEEAATAMFERIRERWPDEAAAWKALARRYAQSDDPSAAELALSTSQRAIELLPDDASARADRALALVRAGRVAEARREADLAGEIDPDQREAARSSLFAVRMTLGELATATTEALRMIAGSAPQQAGGLIAIAMADLYLGRYERGLAGMEHAARAYDQLGMSVAAARTRYHAGRHALALGRRGAARTSLATVADGATYYRAAARALVAVIDGDVARARELARQVAGGPIDGSRLAIEIAAMAGDDAAVIELHGSIASPSAAAATAGFAAAVLERRGRRADALELYRRLVDHPDAWREPIASTRAWRRIGDLSREDDPVAARLAYEVYLRRSENAQPDSDLRAIRAWLARPP